MRVALVGLGEAGFGMHLPALSGMAGVQLAGVCDRDAGRRDLAAARFAVPAFDDVDRLLGETAPEAVVIATPPDSHVDLCLRALAAGAHVVCEKPFVPTVAEADRVIAAARTAVRGVAVNHQFREMPIFRALLGDPIHAEGLAFAQVWQNVDLPPGSETGWRGELERRSLFEAGVHLVDFLLALFREAPVTVQASTSACGLGPGAGDAVVLLTLEFSGGRLAHLTQDRIGKGERQYFEARADTRLASYRASFGGRLRLSAGLHRSTSPHLRFERGLSGTAWREVGSRRTQLARNPRAPMVAATRRVLEESFAAFRSGTPPPAGAAGARDVVRVVEAAYESAASGRRVRPDA